MNRIVLVFVTGVLTTLLACNAPERNHSASQVVQDSVQPQPTNAQHAHWTYSGEEGPAHWGGLDPVYNLCAAGKSQSPVNIEQAAVKGNSSWKLDYKPTSLQIAHHEHMDEILNNGHTIQVTVDEGSTLTLNGKVYHLKQFHFHTPSEHTINGQQAPMEMHWVHQSDDAALAVVSVLFNESATANKDYEALIDNLPAEKGQKLKVDNLSLDLDVHLPDDNFAWHYTGSLTTPPCSENVQWLVLRERVSLSKEQIQAFASRIGPNNRPVQPLNDRVIQAADLSAEVK